MTDDFSAWIGKSVTRHDIVTERLMLEYCATLAPHLFQPADSEEAPPGLHWCLGLPAHESHNLGPDGAEAKGLFLPPVPLPRRMWAGGAVETLQPLRLGDTVTRVSTVSDVKQRDGRAGKLCFVTVSHAISANGVPAIRERHDILLREAGRPAAALPAASPAADLEWQVEASPLLLFRFSAITFNGHRIHYDLPWARDVEGYSGLLVHGPLQAALTLNQLAVLNRAVPARFTYRCVAPLVAGGSFRVWSLGQSAGISTADGVQTIEAGGEFT